MKDKIIVKLIEPLKTAKHKEGAIQWQFYNHSLGPVDFRTIENLGIGVYIEMECIDERVSAQTILSGKIRLEVNTPGGGFDYLTEKDIQKLLVMSRGEIVLDPHRNCGWGGLRLNYYQRQLRKIETLSGVFPNGLSYIRFLAEWSFRENNFLNSIARSPKFQEKFGFKIDYEKFLRRVFKRKNSLNLELADDKDLLEIAFAYAKMNELRQKFQQQAESFAMFNSFIRLNPDMLFDQPHHHVAKGAVLNLTNRTLTKRFAIEGPAETSFFADVDMERMVSILDLIIKIMEGEHSATADSDHNVYIMTPQAKSNEVMELLNQYKQRVKAIKTYKHIFIYLIGENDRPKSRQDILNLVR